jgi:FMN phosphatase YigB (HAD superfamily)
LIKHISFDFWRTLAVSNPKFSELRLIYLQKNYLKHLHLTTIEEIIEKVGEEVDEINMNDGVSLPPSTMYSMVFNKLDQPINRASLKKIIEDIDNIFLDNPPKLFSKEIPKILDELKTNNFSMNISSNTAYIKGNMLGKAMKLLKIHDYFNFYIFSDEINHSKPSPHFFKSVIDNCSNFGISSEQIIHVGDSYRADIIGATESQIKSIQVNANNVSIREGLCQENILQHI